MRPGYKITSIFIFIFLCASIYLEVDYQRYNRQKEKQSAIVNVSKELSINYPQGKEISGSKTLFTLPFSVTNNGEEESEFYVRINEPTGKSEKANITLSCNQKEISNEPFPETEKILASYIKVEAKQTKSCTLTIENPEAFSISLILEVAREEKVENSFKDTILQTNQPKENTLTSVGSEPATENEGLIKQEDSYIFRGKNETNYVLFADLLWRVVKINEDDTVKLVLDNTIASKELYNLDYEELETRLTYENSAVDVYLRQWYDEHLSVYESLIANEKFCTDNSIAKIEANKITYSAQARVETDKTPILTCLGTETNGKIGLLTIDEILFAGASFNTTNTSYYLYNEEIKNSWWTMTPVTSTDNQIIYYEMGSSGNILKTSEGNLFREIRPVINIIKKAVAKGTGTKEDPYTINT